MACASGTSYTVQSGDTLYLIAQRMLGNGERWSEIKNCDGSSPDPTRLEPGQELCLPGGSPSRPPDHLQTVIALTNQERAKHGLPALAWNEHLFSAAQGHSQDMANGDYFDHRDLVNRARQEGYPSSFVGENIAAGRPTPEEVMSQWMNSPGHRNNILNPDYAEIGVGYHYIENDPGRFQYKHYWTQIFGKR